MPTVSELVAAAEKHIEARNFEDAAALLRQAAARAPSAVHVLKPYAACLLAEGEFETAIGVLQRAHQLRPDDAGINYDLAMAYYADEEIDKARPAFERAIVLEPENPAIQEGYGIFLVDTGEIQRGLEFLLMALRVNPHEPDLLAQTGLALTRIGALYDAKSYLDQAIEGDPENLGARLLRVNILNAMDQCGEALEQLEAIYLQRPRDHQVMTMLGATLCRVGRVDEALSLIDVVRRAEEGYLPAFEAYAMACTYDGRPDDGLRALAEVTRALKEPEFGFLMLAQALLQAGRLDEADVAARRALTKPRIGPYAREIIRQASALKGDHRAYLEALEPGRRTDFSDSGDLDAVTVSFETKSLEAIVLARLLASDLTSQSVFAAEPLLPLLGRMIDPGRLTGLGQLPADMPADRFIPIKELDALLFQRKARVFSPYLSTDPAHDRLWTDALKELPRPLIGIVWNRYDPQPRLTDILPALAPIGGTILSLEWDEDVREELAGMPGIVDAGYHFTSLEACIDCIGKLDLVVGSDSLQLHFAGAMGKPGVALLPPNREWYWQVDGGCAFWYPSLRCVERTWEAPWSDHGSRIETAVREIVQNIGASDSASPAASPADGGGHDGAGA